MKAIARQLTLIDYTYFSQVTPQDVAGASWLAPESASPGAASSAKSRRGISVVAALCWAIDVTQWVTSTIVTPAESTDRQLRLHVWIQVCASLQAQKSYNLCFSVARGLLHPLIYALPEFAALAKDDVQTYYGRFQAPSFGALWRCSL